MADLRSAEGWKAYLDQFANHRAKLSEKEEQKLVSATLFLNRHPITGQPFKTDSAIVVVGKFTDTDASKDSYMKIVRAASVCGDAFASVYVSEAWMSVAYGATTEEEALKQIGGMPSQDPKRREVLLMMCEHRTAEHCTMTSVIETVGRRRRCQPWERTELFDGRFAGIVSPTPIRESMDTMLIRSYLKDQIAKGRISDIIPLEPDDVLD